MQTINYLDIVTMHSINGHFFCSGSSKDPTSRLGVVLQLFSLMKGLHLKRQHLNHFTVAKLPSELC